MCKKRKLNSLLEKYTYPSPNKAICLLKSNSSNKTQNNIGSKNSDSSDKTKINIANKNRLNSDLLEKTKLHIENKNKSKKSCPNMKNNNLTKSNDSKMTESKISKNLQPTMVPQQKLVTPKMTKAVNFCKNG